MTISITASGEPIPALSSHASTTKLSSTGGATFVELLLSKAREADAASGSASSEDSDSKIQRDLLNAVSALSLRTHRPSDFLANPNSAKASPKSNQKRKLDLFSLSEKKLEAIDYYKVLGVEFSVSPEEAKKAYHLACLDYHPDKTGRGEEDAVFLKVKAAFDTLSEFERKRTYDSSTCFDDTIPPEGVDERRFYKVYAPVFERNYRFAVRVPVNNDNGKSRKRQSKKSSKSSSSKQQEEDNGPAHIDYVPLPEFGDDNTPIEKVNAFYDYWISFNSWRDFTLAASKAVDKDLDSAGDREEKRWMMKEVETKKKKMKKDEVTRVATLVERAMKADPRLRREKLRAAAEKANAKAASAEAERLKLEAETLARETAEREAAEKAAVEEMAAANKKALLEKEKKILRKAKNQLRKLAIRAFELSEGGQHPSEWAGGLAEMEEEIEYLLEKSNVDEINGLCVAMGEKEDTINMDSLSTLRQCYKDVQDGAESAFLKAESEKMRLRAEAEEKARLEKAASASKPWSETEMTALIKATKKYPAGGANRWEVIAQFINSLLCLPDPRSKDECIKKYEAMKVEKANKEAADKKKAEDLLKAVAGEEKKDSERVEEVDKDGWTATQTADLQEALKTFKSEMDKKERWTAIGNYVDGKTMKECVAKYKIIREEIKNGVGAVAESATKNDASVSSKAKILAGKGRKKGKR